MPALRLTLLWHQHQPFYKDLVSGRYRLPWVRLHALKDYYGMVKLLDEFPNVHQNFNVVPSLVTQIQDYVEGTAQDPFLNVVAKPAKDLSADERRFALQSYGPQPRIDGVEIVELTRHADDGGSMTELLHLDGATPRGLAGLTVRQITLRKSAPCDRISPQEDGCEPDNPIIKTRTLSKGKDANPIQRSVRCN